MDADEGSDEGSNADADEGGDEGASEPEDTPEDADEGGEEGASEPEEPPEDADEGGEEGASEPEEYPDNADEGGDEASEPEESLEDKSWVTAKKDWAGEVVEEFLEWYRKGRAGAPSSASLKTPSPRAPYLPTNECETPAPVAEPFKKRLLNADLKMTKQLERLGLGKEAIKEIKMKRDEEKTRKDAAKLAKDQERAEKLKAREQTDGTAAKKPRAARAGPMTGHLERFIAAKKAEGYAYHAALKLWTVSEERKKILEGLSESECKRRKYK